jgi:hypothetical protein
MRGESSLAMARSATRKHNMDALDSSATPTPMGPVVVRSAVAKVWDALNGGKFDWRSLEGIAAETHLPPLEVSNILEQQLANEVVRSIDKNHPGAYLYATRERYNKIRGPWNRVLSVITNQVK